MIYTVTLNPSIDYIMRPKTVEKGEVNRSQEEETFAGGKGINVSRVLKRLGSKSVALGFLGGFTGEFIEKSLKNEQILCDFTQVKEDTRINVKIKANEETEINGSGPNVTKSELLTFLSKLDELNERDVVVLAGSVPKNMSATIYKKMIEKIKERRANFVLDTEGEVLLQSLASEPLLVKPNKSELEGMFGIRLSTKEEIIKSGQELLQRGAKNVIVSMAGDGAFLITQEGVYFAPAIKGAVKNSVGAGDSMVAGFLSEITQGKTVLEAFEMGVASGTATAFSDDLAEKAYVLEKKSEVAIEKII
ncbi:1-phosphofructokinase [Pilibacter termitis]|uniref:Tagatose-6-phosphate kinase n=1 Tax=Pilibacter termitis TaxID=263852 RepID=A0A1T4LP45_9ENTE|nr:1-phosphofructokinase [Pilibacter termitis]SJZ56433.1 1-phosphofructokinase [Pilibacter termitis]